MQLGLSSLFGSVLSWKKTSPKKRRPSCRGRRLLGERLETRYALAGDVVEPELPPLDGDLETVPADEPAVVAAEDPSTETSPDQFYTGNIAPLITMFSYSFEGAWLTISGAVTDDQDSTGYVIQLTGLFNATITVGTNDTFSQVFAWDPANHGVILGQTQDGLGLFSNIAFIAF